MNENNFHILSLIHKQRDIVTVSSSLEPLLANIIMTELENDVIEPVIANHLGKYY